MRADMLDALDRVALRGAGYRHSAEGPDDMPVRFFFEPPPVPPRRGRMGSAADGGGRHIVGAALTRASVTVPISEEQVGAGHVAEGFAVSGVSAADACGDRLWRLFRARRCERLDSY